MTEKEKTRKNLIKITESTGDLFAEAETGMFRFVTGEYIPILNIHKRDRSASDGFYALSTQTCSPDSGCSIDNPPEACYRSMAYQKGRCAVYCVQSIKYYKLSITLHKMLDLM